MHVVGDRGIRWLLQALVIYYHHLAPLEDLAGFWQGSGQTLGLYSECRKLWTSELDSKIYVQKISLLSAKWLIKKLVPVCLFVLLLHPFLVCLWDHKIKENKPLTLNPFTATWLTTWNVPTQMYYPQPALWFLSNVFLYWLCTPPVIFLIHRLNEGLLLATACLIALCATSLWVFLPAKGADWTLWESLYISPWSHCLTYLSGVLAGVYYIAVVILCVSGITVYVPRSKDPSLDSPWRVSNPEADYRYPLIIPFLLVLTAFSAIRRPTKSVAARFFDARWFASTAPSSVTLIVYILHFRWNEIFMTTERKNLSTETLPGILTCYIISILADRYVVGMLRKGATCFAEKWFPSQEQPTCLARA